MIKTSLSKTAEFIERHKTGLLISATVVAVLATAETALMRYGLIIHDDFLIEKGLYDEFYDLGN